MRVFICSTCGHELQFESVACPNCASVVGYLPDRRDVVVLVADGPARHTVAGDARAHWRCLNASWGCNWMLPADMGDVWCLSCRLTRGRPDESDPAAVVAWSAAEAAKRRLVFQLGELGLPIQPRSSVAPQGLAFDLVHVPGASAVTGHDRGLITLDLSEADERHRDELRRQFGEPFRTLIGHLRHEVGHYYFAHLVSGNDDVDGFRSLFGDECTDYAAALERHYRSVGTTVDEHDLSRYVTAYAAAHPLEDWAETFAHYLHNARRSADRRQPRSVRHRRHVRASHRTAAKGRRRRLVRHDPRALAARGRNDQRHRRRARIVPPLPVHVESNGRHQARVRSRPSDGQLRSRGPLCRALTIHPPRRRMPPPLTSLTRSNRRRSSSPSVDAGAASRCSPVTPPRARRRLPTSGCVAPATPASSLERAERR